MLKFQKMTRWRLAASALTVAMAAPVAFSQSPTPAQCVGYQPLDAGPAAAQTCADVARGRDSRSEAARAFFNAAQGEFTAYQGDRDPARLARAATYLTQSTTDLNNSQLLALTFRNDREARAQTGVRNRDWPALRDDFIYRRVMLSGLTYSGLAEAHAANRVPPGLAVACPNTGDCAETGLARLEADQALLGLSGAKASNFHVLRGDLLRDSRRPNAEASALAAYAQAAEAGRGLAQEGAANARLEALALALGADAGAGSTPGQLANAISFYDQVLRVNPASLKALMGKGQAYAALADISSRDEAGRRSDYASAVNTFSAAASAAGADQASLAEVYVQSGLARANWARLLSSRQSGASSGDAAQLRQLAAGDFRRALDAGGNRFDILEPLAGVLSEGGGEAELQEVNRRVIISALDLPAGASWTVPANPAERSALRLQVDALAQNRRAAIARALIGLGPNEENNLLAAEIAAPWLVGPAMQLAELYASRQNPEGALPRIDTVLQLTAQSHGVVRPGMETYRARAHFLRSRIRFASEASGRLVVEDADNALRLLPGEAIYANWSCAARIVAGGEFVRGAAAVNSGCSGLATGEREALRGMFLLRAAQHAARADQQRQLRNQAQLAFRGGDARLSDLGDAYRTHAGAFDWGPEGDGPKRLRSILRYGEALAVSCSGSDQFPQLNAEEINHARAFFAWHRVADCRL